MFWILFLHESASPFFHNSALHPSSPSSSSPSSPPSKHSSKTTSQRKGDLSGPSHPVLKSPASQSSERRVNFKDMVGFGSDMVGRLSHAAGKLAPYTKRIEDHVSNMHDDHALLRRKRSPTRRHGMSPPPPLAIDSSMHDVHEDSMHANSPTTHALRPPPAAVYSSPPMHGRHAYAGSQLESRVDERSPVECGVSRHTPPPPQRNPPTTPPPKSNSPASSGVHQDRHMHGAAALTAEGSHVYSPRSKSPMHTLPPSRNRSHASPNHLSPLQPPPYTRGGSPTGGSPTLPRPPAAGPHSTNPPTKVSFSPAPTSSPPMTQSWLQETQSRSAQGVAEGIAWSGSMHTHASADQQRSGTWIGSIVQNLKPLTPGERKIAEVFAKAMKANKKKKGSRPGEQSCATVVRGVCYLRYHRSILEEFLNCAAEKRRLQAETWWDRLGEKLRENPKAVMHAAAQPIANTSDQRWLEGTQYSDASVRFSKPNFPYSQDYTARTWYLKRLVR